MKSMSAIGLLTIVAPLAWSGAADPQCEEVPGAEFLLRSGAILLLGEIHGTEEAPVALASLVCQALSRGLTVTVGLEIPRKEQEVTDRYLVSEGTFEDQRRFLESDWWQRDYQDGRSSQAMFDLLLELRSYKADPTALKVILIDDPGSPLGRDRAMASLLAAEIERRPDDLFVVLTGNLHNRLRPGRFEPMGYHLQLAKPDADIIALNITHSGGSAWVCTTDACGVLNVRGETGVSPGIEIHPQASDSAYTGRLHVGRVKASPPARGPAR